MQSTAFALVLQHADFQRVNPTAMELGTPGGNAGPSAKQKKSKKRRSRSSLQPCRKVASRDVLGEHSGYLCLCGLGWQLTCFR